MPKTIQTGETVTLSDLRVEQVTFSWAQETVEPETDPPTTKEVLHVHVAYARMKDDGSVHDRAVREVTPGQAVIDALNTYRNNQRTANRTAEGI